MIRAQRLINHDWYRSSILLCFFYFRSSYMKDMFFCILPNKGARIIEGSKPSAQ